MHSFKNDYSEGCHPRILEALTRTNLEQTVGYGLDGHCENAAQLLRTQFACPDADIHFLCGGTQTNLTAISAFLRPHHCVLSASTGHVNVHETGAIEATGHKVVTLPTPDGKLNARLVQTMVDTHTDEHMVKPGLVYISQSTEMGTVYTLQELEELRTCCDKNGLLLYLDGARLGCALTSTACDVKPFDLARLCDAFYVGGTKNGALFGEAMIIVNDALKADFRFFIKQRGGMLAKGRLLGIQFEELFRDGLYFELARHSNRLAHRLQEGLMQLGIPMFVPSTSNLVFPVVTPEQYRRFAALTLFEDWDTAPDGRKVIRLVTSWAAEGKDIDDLLEALK
ncbi:MAG: aminotransferase class V-fold PLP-dependent enzyme [Oscillospiraceae bacterium]|nr:aminotransferase class V-fold PLP-dependent enzyme [Oscillospiraceae bacterium]